MRWSDVAEELGVDAIGLNHLMFSTPEEVAETVRLTGAPDAEAISTFVTSDPGVDAARVQVQVDRLIAKCRERGIRFDMRPKVRQPSSRTTTRPARRSRAGACIRFSTRACRSAARHISVRSSASRSAT